MKKRIVSIVTCVMMSLIVFGFGGVLTSSAVETDGLSSSTEEERIDIGHWSSNIYEVYLNGLYPDNFGQTSSYFEYTGEVINPEIDLCYCYNDEEGNYHEDPLEKDVDYIITSYPEETKNLGKYVIEYEGIGKYKGTKEVEFYIVHDITKAEFSYETELYYTGKKLEDVNPPVTVTYNGKTLKKDEDYSVRFYYDCKEVGTYERAIFINGKGNYGGSIVLPITIKDVVDLKTEATVKYSTSYNYTGNVINPPTVKVGNQTLVSGRDYTIEYLSGTKAVKAVKYPGTYNFVIKGIGKYRGEIKKSFTINAPKPTVSITKVSTAKKSPYIQYKTTVPGASKIVYKVMYRVGTGTTWTTVSSGTTKTKLTVSKLANQSKYTVAVIATATVNGKNYVSKTAIKNNKGYAPVGTAIYTADDFKKIKTNSTKAKYYLANDITLPANTQIKGTFTGTLDGNGFAIKNYKYSASKWCEAGLFHYAKGAILKNIKMTGVSMSVKSNSGAYIAPLVRYAEKCTFSNVKTYGKITASGTSATYDGQGGFNIGGIAATATGSKFSGCTNDVDIVVTSRLKYGEVTAGGISSSASSGYISSCSNTGTISATGYSDYHFAVAGLVGGNVKTATSCNNSGKVTITYESKQNGYGNIGGAAGICGTVSNATSCKNTGAITVKTSSSAKPKSVYVAGAFGDISGKNAYATKCYNKGKVTFSGNVTGSQYQGAFVGGVAAKGNNVSQCFNKGAVKVTTSSDWANVGGVCGVTYSMSNNYNAASVTASSKGNVGGVAGEIDAEGGGKVFYNYNSAKVTGKSGMKKGSIAGMVFSNMFKKTNVNYNYYKKGTASKGYGSTYVTNKYKPKSTKVTALTKAKCKKLSSKYWKYNKKVKRMVLKNNPE